MYGASYRLVASSAVGVPAAAATGLGGSQADWLGLSMLVLLLVGAAALIAMRLLLSPRPRRGAHRLGPGNHRLERNVR